MTDPDDLIVTALNAMAASQDGWTNMHDLMAHLETRLGSTDEEAKDARSPQSRSFRETFMRLGIRRGRLGQHHRQGVCAVRRHWRPPPDHRSGSKIHRALTSAEGCHGTSAIMAFMFLLRCRADWPQERAVA